MNLSESSSSSVPTSRPRNGASPVPMDIDVPLLSSRPSGGYTLHSEEVTRKHWRHDTRPTLLRSCRHSFLNTDYHSNGSWCPSSRKEELDDEDWLPYHIGMDVVYPSIKAKDDIRRASPSRTRSGMSTRPPAPGSSPSILLPCKPSMIPSASPSPPRSLTSAPSSLYSTPRSSASVHSPIYPTLSKSTTRENERLRAENHDEWKLMQPLVVSASPGNVLVRKRKRSVSQKSRKIPMLIEREEGDNRLSVPFMSC